MSRGDALAALAGGLVAVGLVAGLPWGPSVALVVAALAALALLGQAPAAGRDLRRRYRAARLDAARAGATGWRAVLRAVWKLRGR